MHPGKALAQTHMQRWQPYPCARRTSRTRRFKALMKHTLCNTTALQRTSCHPIHHCKFKHPFQFLQLFLESFDLQGPNFTAHQVPINPLPIHKTVKMGHKCLQTVLLREQELQHLPSIVPADNAKVKKETQKKVSVTGRHTSKHIRVAKIRVPYPCPWPPCPCP